MAYVYLFISSVFGLLHTLESFILAVLTFILHATHLMHSPDGHVSH
jgi:hypothetical protein